MCLIQCLPEVTLLAAVYGRAAFCARLDLFPVSWDDVRGACKRRQAY